MTDDCGHPRDHIVVDSVGGLPPYVVLVPCRWPSCLSKTEVAELAIEALTNLHPDLGGMQH